MSEQLWQCLKCGPCGPGIPGDQGEPRCSNDGCDGVIAWRQQEEIPRVRTMPGAKLRLTDEQWTALKRKRSKAILGNLEAIQESRRSAEEGRKIVAEIEVREGWIKGRIAK